MNTSNKDAPALDVAALSDAGKNLRRKTHSTLAKADDDYGRRLQFNTVVSAVMELANEIARMDSVTKQTGQQCGKLWKAPPVISPMARICAQFMGSLRSGPL